MNMTMDPHSFLQAELERLDLLLHREILRLRAAYELSLDEFRGLYVSDDYVDGLLAQVARENEAIPDVYQLTAEAENRRLNNWQQLAEDSPWRRLITEFQLSEFESDVLLAAIAPQIELKYETLYAYLNNDVTRKWPTIDLALRLFEDKQQSAGSRRCLVPSARLFQTGLLQSIEPSGAAPTWLATGFLAAPVAGHFAMGMDHFAAGPPPGLKLVEDPGTREIIWLSGEERRRLEKMAALVAHGGTAPLLVFEGPASSGQEQAAKIVSEHLQQPLLSLDLRLVAPNKFASLMPSVTLFRRLYSPSLLVQGTDALFDQEGRPTAEARVTLGYFLPAGGPIILAFSPQVQWPVLLAGRTHLSFTIEQPEFNRRRRMWDEAAAENGIVMTAELLEAISGRFTLNQIQIKQAAQMAAAAMALDGPSVTATTQALFASARAQSSHQLARLAHKNTATHTWEDIVLPPATLQQLQEIAGAIDQRHIVYDTWGFGRKSAAGQGLKVLFSGASGTGKTMAAGIIARELGYDLYAIDLSRVVSKYIGETEKNLDGIFRAAHASNAILFFDEADALFGKRSEVKDAHDRYANIEVSYLLQKMEVHEGVVILASNLRRNIDEAFARRMHYVIEFPIPGEVAREQLWQVLLSPEMPLADDVDLPFLARHFKLPGGDIRNVALDAAFLAAQNGRVVCMVHFIKAMSRQMVKQGQIPSVSDFKQYYEMIKS